MNTATADRLARARAMWRWVGDERPPFADTPAPEQESVWDFPRPPRLQADPREIVVMAGDVEIARTRAALRLCETASPPTFYLPAADVQTRFLVPGQGSSGCEWKGLARYWNIRIPEDASGNGAGNDARVGAFDSVAWSYPDPQPPYEALAGHFAFYPQQLACFVDGERARPQPGGFYAGWITSELVGPFKGEPGSGGW